MIDIRVAAILAGITVAAFGAEAAGTSSRHGQLISTTAPGSTDSTRLVLAPEGNEARYRVRERIARLEFPSDAVGATNDLTGALVLDEYGKVVAAESKFVVDLRTLKSDRDRRDRYLQRRTIETERYPTIELVPTELPGLPFPLPESGEAHSLTWSHLGHRAGERHEREDGNENCGATHGVVLCGNALRLPWVRQVGVKGIVLGIR